MSEYADRDVVVTGGTGALGSALVTALVERGARVHIPVFDGKELERFPLRAHDRVTLREGVDLSDEVQVEHFYAHVPRLWASIHLAGGFVAGSLLETTPTQLRRMLSMNTVSAFLCCREAVRRMREGADPDAPPAGGRIVNVSAKPALVPSGGVAAYAASKAGVAALTLSLAEELRAEGIWVNAIVPSIMDTPVNRRAMPDADWDAWPKVEDVAETILYLASPRNTATRGALVPVYGRS